MSVRTVIPRVVMSHAVLADLELVLGGVLPADHILGGEIRQADGVPSGLASTSWVGVLLERATADQAQSAGSLLLVDEEQTPLGRLDVVDAAGPGADADTDVVTVLGSLHRERRRESGSARELTLDLGPERTPYDLVVVVGRPPLRADVDALADTVRGLASGPEPRILLVVPDHPSDTAGVPTHLMTRLTTRLGERLAAATGTIPPRVATAPLARRGAPADTALVQRLAAHLGAPAYRLLADDPGTDPAAVGWLEVARGLRGEGSGWTRLLVDGDLPLLRSWRRPPGAAGLVIMFTGLSGSGKSTIARALHHRIEQEGRRTVSLLDGDVVRQMLSSGLGFDRAGRTLNIRRIGFVAAEIARHGGIAICAPVAPYADTRLEARRMAEAVGDFLLIHVSTPLAECERRDLKGLYAQARQGLIPEFTGISDPYEVPTDADLTIDTTDLSTADAVEAVLARLALGRWLAGER